jgi:hypothetical protein
MAGSVSNVNLRIEEQWDPDHGGYSRTSVGSHRGRQESQLVAGLPDGYPSTTGSSANDPLHAANGLRAAGPRPVDSEDVQHPEEASVSCEHWGAAAWTPPSQLHRRINRLSTPSAYTESRLAREGPRHSRWGRLTVVVRDRFQRPRSGAPYS